MGRFFLACPDEGIIFTGDSLINFDSLSEDRRRYNLLAKKLNDFCKCGWGPG